MRLQSAQFGAAELQRWATLTMDESTIATIVKNVKSELLSCEESLRLWANAHLIKPHVITASCKPDRVEPKSLYLITDHIGVNDSNYRIVYDEDAAQYGLECTTSAGISWYMGPYGSFSKALRSM